jgi:hypothetical protein
MTIADVPDPAGGSAAPRVTREQQLRAALAQHTDALAAIARDRVAAWLGFDSGVYELTRPGEAGPARPVALAAPTGRRSDLGAAIQEALAKAAARRVSGIVVFSDGQSTDEVPDSVKRRLRSELIGVFVVPLGSPTALADLRVRTVDRPEIAFLRDTVPVDVTVELAGAATGVPFEARALLIDRASGQVLDQRPVTFPATGDPRTAQVRLGSNPSQGREADWAVRLVPGGSSSAALLRTPADVPVRVKLIDRPMRVLYIDGYPRWEYRYLKNLLARERSITFSALLLAPGRRYLQEGTRLLDAVPSTPQEWDQFDVIILGDVRPEVFSRDQFAQLRARVASGGAGLLWIGGPGPTPGGWRGTPLADLLPFLLSGDSTQIEAWGREVVMKPAPLAERLGVLRLADTPGPDGSMWPPAVSDPGAGWSRFRYAQRLNPALLKPAAEVLAEFQGFDTAGQPAGPPAPAVATMRFGLGRVIYVATDEIWRWRYGRGEDLPERFWIQLIRLLGRDAVAKSGQPAIITLTPPRATVGQAVSVSVQILDQALLSEGRPSVPVRLERVGPLPDAPPEDETVSVAPVELTLRPVATGDDAEATRAGQTRSPAPAATFAATWIPSATGVFRATIADNAITARPGAEPGEPPSAQAEVYYPDDELRRPQTDHARLEALAKETGGQVIAADKLDELERLLPRKERRLPGVGQERTLWDSPLALILLVLLLTAEWVGRRLIRLI